MLPVLALLIFAYGLARQRRRFHVWKMAQPCRQRSEKESDRADARLDRCRPEDLFENLRYVSWKNRRRGRPGRD